jgi:hypothetical protein
MEVRRNARLSHEPSRRDVARLMVFASIASHRSYRGRPQDMRAAARSKKSRPYRGREFVLGYFFAVTVLRD